METYQKSHDSAKRLIMQTKNMEGVGEVVYLGELFLLRKVFEAASDFMKAKLWKEFGEYFPPEEMQQTLFNSVVALEKYFSD